MEHETDLNILERLKIVTGAATDIELAQPLSLTKQSISNARNNGKVPSSWVLRTSKMYNVSTDWLFFGVGSMYKDTSQPQPTVVKLEEPAAVYAKKQVTSVNTCLNCATLQAELNEERKERREVSIELREVNAENRNLLKENGELKEKCARLEANQVSPQAEKKELTFSDTSPLARAPAAPAARNG